MQLKNPKWVDEILKKSTQPNNNRITEINTRLDNWVSSKSPIVSIVIPVKNEENNILNCLDSLSKNNFSGTVEIIIVNNNSTDNTNLILDKLNVTTFEQPLIGIGWARQMGLEAALGMYVLTADADCIYHGQWITAMLDNLKKDKVVCVSGRYSFIGDGVNGRIKLQLYELLRNLIIKIRHRKHPYLNARGGCMGYLKSIALDIGYDTRNLRGEDGRLCYDFMRKGKVAFIDSTESRVWTYINSEQPIKKGLFIGIIKNLNKELWRSLSYLRRPRVHDTKYSTNTPDSFRTFIKGWKKNRN